MLISFLCNISKNFLDKWRKYRKKECSNFNIVTPLKILELKEKGTYVKIVWMIGQAQMFSLNSF